MINTRRITRKSDDSLHLSKEPKAQGENLNNLKVFKQGKLMLTLDKNRVYPDDPGADTPAMVSYADKYFASYNCAVNEEVLLGDEGDYQLSDRQVTWLANLDDELTEFLYPRG